MEDNNQNEQTENKDENKHICFQNHCWKMCLGMVLAAFFGGFLATYFVAENVNQNHFVGPKFEGRNFDDFDREMKHNIKMFNKMMERNHFDEFNQKEFDVPPMFLPEPIKIESEYENGNFNIEIGLKSFQNDESKINYNVSGRKLTVFGKSKVEDGKNEQSISFSHDFILPENADTMNIQKIKNGDKLIISVPTK